MAVKQISTASEDIPFSTSDSDPNPDQPPPEFLKIPPVIVNRQLDLKSRCGSARSLASQVSLFVIGSLQVSNYS
jgi:hypothetical protein